MSTNNTKAQLAVAAVVALGGSLASQAALALPDAPGAWEKHQQDQPPARVSADPGPWRLAVYRQAGRVKHRDLSRGHFRVLTAIRDDATIGELASDALCPSLAPTLPELIGTGLVTGVRA